jgi:hypothetical protein
VTRRTAANLEIDPKIWPRQRRGLGRRVRDGWQAAPVR